MNYLAFYQRSRRTNVTIPPESLTIPVSVRSTAARKFTLFRTKKKDGTQDFPDSIFSHITCPVSTILQVCVLHT